MVAVSKYKTYPISYSCAVLCKTMPSAGKTPSQTEHLALHARVEGSQDGGGDCEERESSSSNLLQSELLKYSCDEGLCILQSDQPSQVNTGQSPT